MPYVGDLRVHSWFIDCGELPAFGKPSGIALIDGDELVDFFEVGCPPGKLLYGKLAHHWY